MVMWMKVLSASSSRWRPGCFGQWMSGGHHDGEWAADDVHLPATTGGETGEVHGHEAHMKLYSAWEQGQLLGGGRASAHAPSPGVWRHAGA